MRRRAIPIPAPVRLGDLAAGFKALVTMIDGSRFKPGCVADTALFRHWPASPSLTLWQRQDCSAAAPSARNAVLPDGAVSAPPSPLRAYTVTSLYTLSAITSRLVPAKPQ